MVAPQFQFRSDNLDAAITAPCYAWMMDTGYIADPDIAIHAIKQRTEETGRFLCQSSVFFAVRDERHQTTRVAGSGVVVDLHGTKIVLTAGHVLRDFRREFDNGQMILSVNRPCGSFAVRRDSVRLVSPGGDRGADAGVLILPPDQVESYFQFGGFEPARATTLRPELPPTGVACIVGGYPAQGAEFFTAEGPGGPYHWVHATFNMIGARLLHSDNVHHWLDMSNPPPDTERLKLGELNGMSGCGFWSLKMRKDTTTDPITYDLRAHLHGVHTATVDDEIGLRLRQTPIAHHLRLLADESDELKDKVMRLWPGLV